MFTDVALTKWTLIDGAVTGFKSVYNFLRIYLTICVKNCALMIVYYGEGEIEQSNIFYGIVREFEFYQY